MFTGLVETVGKIVEVRRTAGGPTRLGIASSLSAQSLADGESIAVDGVCLSVVARGRDRFQADVVAETLRRTTLSGVRVGSKVNLERALRVGDRLGGHWVQGHVDGTAPLIRRSASGADHRLEIALPADLRRFVAFKGSVTLNGVSLTVADVHRDRFEVALVPHTLDNTTLAGLRPGQRVNVEVDLLTRYLDRLLEERASTAAGGTGADPGRTGG